MEQSYRNKYKKCCGCNNKPCGCNTNGNEGTNDTCDCYKYKVLANEKMDKSSDLNEKATKVAQQAKQECARSNQLWNQYQELSDKVIGLMDDAQE